MQEFLCYFKYKHRRCYLISTWSISTVLEAKISSKAAAELATTCRDQAKVHLERSATEDYTKHGKNTDHPLSLKASSGPNLEEFESNLSLISLHLIDLRNAWSCNKPELKCLIPRSLVISTPDSSCTMRCPLQPPEQKNDKLWQMPLKLCLRLMFHYIHVPQHFHLECCFYKVWYWEILTLLPTCLQFRFKLIFFFFIISSQGSPVL